MNPSLRIRFKRKLTWLARSVANALRGPRTVYVNERLDEYRGYWEAAARALSARFDPLTAEVWEITLDGKRTRISNHLIAIDDPVTLRLSGDKGYCYRLAERHGIPTPRHLLFTLEQVDTAREFLREEAGTYVVKPARASSSGLGVTTRVRTRRQLEAAACLASLFCDELLVERMIFGESHRLLFLDGEFLHAVRRRGVRLAGDGRSSLRQLLTAKGRAGLVEDATTRLTLEAQGLTADSVPANGEEVLVRSLPEREHARRELRTIYDENVTQQVSGELVAELRPLVRAAGTRFAGVDVITRNAKVTLRESGGVFIEINTTPGIHHHYVEPPGDDEPVAVRILRHLLGAVPEQSTGARPADEGV